MVLIKDCCILSSINITIAFYTFWLKVLVTSASLNFKVTRWSTRIDSKREFLPFPGLSLEQCVFECSIRTECKSVCFKRRMNFCEVHLNEVTDFANPDSTGSCVYIRREDITFPEVDTACSCGVGKVCSVTTGQCISKECQPFHITNGKIYGNLWHTNAKQRIECDDGYEAQNGVNTVVCGSEGTWDYEPVCVLKTATTPVSATTTPESTTTTPESTTTTSESTTTTPESTTTTPESTTTTSESTTTTPESTTTTPESTTTTPESTTTTPESTTTTPESTTTTPGSAINCTADWIYPFSNTSFKINFSETSGKQSDGICQSIQARLVKIDTEWKQTFIEKAITTCTGFSANCRWIDGTWNGTAWVFSDSSDMPTSNVFWNNGEPGNQDCVSISSTGRWTTQNCNNKCKFICERVS